MFADIVFQQRCSKESSGIKRACGEGRILPRGSTHPMNTGSSTPRTPHRARPNTKHPPHTRSQRVAHDNICTPIYKTEANNPAGSKGGGPPPPEPQPQQPAPQYRAGGKRRRPTYVLQVIVTPSQAVAQPHIHLTDALGRLMPRPITHKEFAVRTAQSSLSHTGQPIPGGTGAKPAGSTRICLLESSVPHPGANRTPKSPAPD